MSRRLAVGQLREGHDPELFRASQRANVLVATVARDVAAEGRPRQEIHELGEQRLASVHGGLRAKPGRLPELAITVQIDTTLRHPEILISYDFQRFSSSFNRTAV